jgi:hypothetical protein
VPQAAPSSTYSLRPPFSPQHLYDTASGNNAAARPASSYSFDASAALPPRPSDPCVDPCTINAGETPGVLAGRQLLGHATALDAGFLLLPFKSRPPIHHKSSRLHRGRPRPRQLADWLRHRCVVLLPTSNAAGIDQENSGVRCRLRCDQANRENAAYSARALRMTQRFAEAGSK